MSDGIAGELESIVQVANHRAPPREVRTFPRQAESLLGASLDALESDEVREGLAGGDRSNRYRVIERSPRA